jgi:hypothetical protein
MNTSRRQRYSLRSTMLKTIGIGIVGALIFGLALRTGYHAEQETMPTQAAR